MRIVFHIGMGKTGTSSIQRTLAASESELASQKARYLGMWFNDVAPRFRGHEGLAAFAGESPEAQAGHAETFLDACQRQRRRHDVDTFILSNEGLFGQALRLEPFFRALIAEADVRFVAYVRPPRDWLPSAFTQWTLHHKQQKGPIQPFRERARELITQYDAVGTWIDRYGDHLSLRRFDKSVDIVGDFAGFLGLTLPDTGKRFLERSEPAEIVLRALYNDRFEAPILPDRFDKQVINTNRHRVRSLQDVIDLCFEYEDIDAIIEERRQTFEEIEKRSGVKMLDQQPDEGARAPSYVDVSTRIFDYLISITIEQSIRINRLERRLDELEGKRKS